MQEQSKRTVVALPDSLKSDLKTMSDETGISMAQLIVMATHSLVANYKNKGTFIFVDLLNPEHKVKK